jgi:hypothetical protein
VKYRPKSVKLLQVLENVSVTAVPTVKPKILHPVPAPPGLLASQSAVEKKGVISTTSIELPAVGMAITGAEPNAPVPEYSGAGAVIDTVFGRSLIGTPVRKSSTMPSA